jgi:hypothetical protein
MIKSYYKIGREMKAELIATLVRESARVTHTKPFFVLSPRTLTGPCSKS